LAEIAFSKLAKKMSSNSTFKRLSFTFEGDESPMTPLYAKIGEKCLIALAETLAELIFHDDVLAPLFTKSNVPVNTNMFYNFILHITGRKPCDVSKMRKGHGKIGLKDVHFQQLIKLLGQAMGIMVIKPEVAREVLDVVLAMKEDFKGEPRKSFISFW
jgi:truncated hemoglobin YjbI